MAGIYRAATFKHTDAGFLIVAYIVIGLSVASYTFIVAVPFAKKPTLAAIACESPSRVRAARKAARRGGGESGVVHDGEQRLD